MPGSNTAYLTGIPGMSLAASAQCLSSGRWSIDPPSCERVTCPPLSPATGYFAVLRKIPKRSNFKVKLYNGQRLTSLLTYASFHK